MISGENKTSSSVVRRLELRARAIYSNSFFRRRCIEPRRRLVGGSFGWAVHRFEIKGGISWRDVMLEDARRPNPLLWLLRPRGVILSAKNKPVAGENDAHRL